MKEVQESITPMVQGKIDPNEQINIDGAIGFWSTPFLFEKMHGSSMMSHKKKKNSLICHHTTF